MHERDIVFIGGGHCHALAIRMLAMKPLQNARLTLITDTLQTPYSGMLPGYIAGHYSLDDIHIDLNLLCQRANVRLIHGRVCGLDLNKKEIKIIGQANIRYDKVSINTGSTPNLGVPGAAEFALGVKPVSQLTQTWQTLLDKCNAQKKPHWAIVGAGAAGIEMTLAIAHRFKQSNKSIHLSLVHAGECILPHVKSGTRKIAEKALANAHVSVVSHFRVAEVHQSSIVSTHEQKLDVDQSIWCTPATAPAWPSESGLATDDNGFIAVNEFLQSTSHGDVFACGDVAAMLKSPRPKSGVYAVRSAPFLVKNLRAVMLGNAMAPLNLQTDFLSLISLGDTRAVGQRFGVSFSGNWVWQWKNRIDQAFMSKFNAPLSAMDSVENEPMHCAGCGSKIGPELLTSTLKELPIFPNSTLKPDLTLAEDAAVAAVHQDVAMLQSIDGFRAFTDDMYRLGVVATHHAINDLYAMGNTPTSAQVWVNLAFNHPRLIQRDFKRLMTGITETLLHHETTLVGGHSTEGAETHVALVVNGIGHSVWPKNAVEEGDWLLLNKPLGSGILLAADAQGKAPAPSKEALWHVLQQSNRDFFLAIKNEKIHAATDVTGFGLIGHLLEMLKHRSLAANLNVEDLPLIPGALDASHQGITSSLMPKLLPLLNECSLNNTQQALVNCLIDPQTNGGLLVSTDPSTAKEIIAKTDAVKIGQIQRCSDGMKINLIQS
ncbi:selenide, water dikinase SelD [Reinekea forsetii]|nr:selenide, water dikinase SelD [Reinekea forsetii]